MKKTRIEVTVIVNVWIGEDLELENGAPARKCDFTARAETARVYSINHAPVIASYTRDIISDIELIVPAKIEAAANEFNRA